MYLQSIKFHFARQKLTRRPIFQKLNYENFNTITESVKNVSDKTTIMADNLVDMSTDKTIDKAIFMMNKLHNQMLKNNYEGAQISINVAMGPISIGITKTVTSIKSNNE